MQSINPVFETTMQSCQDVTDLDQLEILGDATWASPSSELIFLAHARVLHLLMYSSSVYLETGIVIHVHALNVAVEEEDAAPGGCKLFITGKEGTFRGSMLHDESTTVTFYRTRRFATPRLKRTNFNFLSSAIAKTRCD